jgi:hypothetical protein
MTDKEFKANRVKIIAKQDRNSLGPWTLAVKKKHDYTCDNCLMKDKKYVAHHLDGFVNFPKLRKDIDNGVCLCVECHIDFHELYGMGHNTKEEYLEFKSMNIPKKILETKDRPIIQLHLFSRKEIKKYNSISDVVIQTGLKYNHILFCCIDMMSHKSMSWWQFYNDNLEEIINKIENRAKKLNHSYPLWRTRPID